MKKIILIVIILILIAAGLFFYFSMQSVGVKTTYSSSSGKIAKIVYQVSAGSAISVYEKDCLRRNGVFQECGNTCAPDAQACDAVCAVTCSFSG